MSNRYSEDSDTAVLEDLPRSPGAVESIREAVRSAAELLPSQGPIEVFVHHNTLHAFEHLPFEQAVAAGLQVHGASPYLSEAAFREHLAQGRIRAADLQAVLLDDLGDQADRLVATLGTRYALRLAILQYPMRTGSGAELNWVIAETDALRKFSRHVPSDVCRRMIDNVKRWITERDTRPAVRRDLDDADERPSDLVALLLPQFGGRSSQAWNDATWEAFVLQFLWKVCCQGLLLARRHPATSARTESDQRQVGWRIVPQATAAHLQMRSRWSLGGALLNVPHSASVEAVRQNLEEAVNNVLIQFCSTFLDQGFAAWELPDRRQGLFQTFLQLYSRPHCSVTPWLRALCRESTRLLELKLSSAESIRESMLLLGVADTDHQAVIEHMLLALPGWAGMIWQMETNAEWAVHPAPDGSLTDYLAVRMITERVAAEVFRRDVETAAAQDRQEHGRLNDLGPEGLSLREKKRAFDVFQLAQLRGWSPRDLYALSAAQWAALITELDEFTGLERRRIYQRAFEKKYVDDTLNAIVRHHDYRRQANARQTTENQRAPSGSAALSAPRAVFQLVCCLDDREESFRRHVEEVEPRCETFGLAGFYGIAMYYRGVTDAHFRPLCPVNIKPRHFVTEEPTYSMAWLSERQAATRRRIGRATHHAHLGSRTFMGGLLTGFLGSFAAVPLVARILFPRTSSRISHALGRIVRPPATQLRIERLAEEPGDQNGHLGYSVEEMANIVEGGLRATGMSRTDKLSPLVLICGHGSGSVNNPHESAYNCGACSGGRGGPNARAFSQMANDHRVRQQLAQRGLPIGDDVHFVGGFHDTCNDSLTWFDLDLLPVRLRAAFERAQAVIDEARGRSARERCRRFASVPPHITPAEALAHVESRAEDLSQARPEYNHATCALCFVGRREWSRGLFLDRRAFLTSYDSRQDGENSPILERLLQAVIPVCAGISLEYYFSTVDNEAYGCGNKLPHNLTSLLGVMTGAASDLRPGLAAQMVEIHEPMRLLFVVETTPQVMQQIIHQNPSIARLVHGGWVQLAVYQPELNQAKIFHRGQFVTWSPTSEPLPQVEFSDQWFQSRRDHLGFASITSAVPPAAGINHL